MLPYLITDLGLDNLFLEFAFTLSGLRIALLEGEKKLRVKNDAPSTKRGARLFLSILFAPNHFLKQPFCGLSQSQPYV